MALCPPGCNSREEEKTQPNEPEAAERRLDEYVKYAVRFPLNNEIKHTKTDRGEKASDYSDVMFARALQ